MRVGFFGPIAAAFGAETELAVPEVGVTVNGLRSLLSHAFDTVDILERSVRAAVNDEIVPETHIVFPGDTIEFLSPVSGG